jgi:hypothetical protein
MTTYACRRQYWIDMLRPSTARFARAQDEERFFMPSTVFLILSSAALKSRRVSKDAGS